MALGIAFHKGGSSIDFSQAVLGLEQDLYELLVVQSRDFHSLSLIRKMVSIGYDDELFLRADQVGQMLDELEQIMTMGKFKHPQLPAFHSVLREAVSRNWGLVFWGDMYPDLSRDEEHA